MIRLIYSNNMDNGAFVNLYLNENVRQGIDGDMFDGVEPVMVVLPLEIGLEELKKIVHQELEILSNQEVEIMRFICPIAVGNIMKYTINVLRNDRHVQHMLLMYSSYPSWFIIELCVHTRNHQIEYNNERT